MKTFKAIYTTAKGNKVETTFNHHCLTTAYISFKSNLLDSVKDSLIVEPYNSNSIFNHLDSDRIGVIDFNI